MSQGYSSFGDDIVGDDRPVRQRPRHTDDRSYDDRSYDDRDDRSERSERRPRPEKQRVHFVVSPRVHVELDYDFAITLGEFLLDVDVIDKRFKSFGHHLCNLAGEDA